MSPEARKCFEEEWVTLSPRLRMLLVRKGIPRGLHDDLIQETALRLLSMWATVDRRRSLAPLTITILLNLLRDRGRTINRDDLVADLPDLKGPQDVESAGMARLELERVRKAMSELSQLQRTALMKEVGAHGAASTPDAAADKMLRMRARRKLRLALENVSALVAIRFRRISTFIESVFALREPGLSAASCVICIVLGIGGTLAVPQQLVPEASARPAPEVGDQTAGAAAATSNPEESIAVDGRAERVAIATAIEETRRASALRRGSGGGSVVEDEAGLLPELPGSGDEPVEPPKPTVVSVPEDVPVGDDPGDGPIDPPVPPLPPAPTLPVPQVPEIERSFI